MQPLSNRLTTLLQRVHVFELMNFGVFVTGLSLLFAFSSSGGIVDRMEAAYPLPRTVVGGLVLVGALIMGIAPERNWKLVGLIPYIAYVIGVWGVTGGYAWQAVIIYSIHALVLFTLIIHPDYDHETS